MSNVTQDHPAASTGITIRPYRDDDEQDWLRCSVLAFLDTAYFDSLFRRKPEYASPAIELVADQRTRAPFPRGAPELARVHREAYKRGAMLRLSGANIIISPALTIERAQIDLLCDALAGAFGVFES